MSQWPKRSKAPDLKDKPFQAYSAARDLVMAVRSGNPASHISRTPIALDGSCSGIQNLSLAFRDEIGGKAVNLMPLEKPADIYAAVAEKTIRALEEIAGGNEPMAQIPQDDEEREKEELRVRAAQWWLDFGITRKVTKRNCMTFPYGSKERGFSDQILEDTLRPFVKDGAALSMGVV